MTAFTRLGSSLWDWEPWTDLGDLYSARMLWLALYTSAEAKRHVPGLWQGGIPSMADAARMPADDVRMALDHLLERDMVEFDPKTRVLRLCLLPDAGECPSNGKTILGWWTRFKTVPACPVRDAHVRTLQWIMDTGATGRGKALTPDHLEAWKTTFGTIAVPAPRRRGIRKLADSDTGTQVQPSLFPASPTGHSHGESGYPQVGVPAVDNSAAMRQHNKNNNVYTVSDTVSDTNRIPDPGSRIPDLSSSFPERGLGGGHDTGMRPVLTLVPPFGPADVLAELAKGPWDRTYDDAFQEAIGVLIPRWIASRVGLAEIRVLAEANALPGGSQRIRNARDLVAADVVLAVDAARRSLEDRENKLAMLRDFRAVAPDVIP